MSDHKAQRQLGGMPTGHYDMADMQFSVHKIEPQKSVESEKLSYRAVIDALREQLGLPPIDRGSP